MRPHELIALIFIDFHQFPLNFLSQIRLINQPTNQPLPIVGIALTQHFFTSGAIWNIHAKFQPNRFRNGDFSPFDQIDQPTDHFL